MYFSEKLIGSIRETGSLACCGIDPRIQTLEKKYVKDAQYWIPSHIVKEQVDEYGKEKGWGKAIETFVKKLVMAVDDYVALYKPNIAFFEVIGQYGWQALKNIITFIHEKTEKTILVDSKRNDIGTSARHYAIALFEWLDADAITVNPYLGKDTITPFLDNFIDDGKGIFILCKTSNPSSADFQDKKIGDSPLFEAVAEKIKAWGGQHAKTGYTNVGAVIGATYPDQLATLRRKLPHTFFLVPGLGIQGGKPAEVARLATEENKMGAVFNSSRGINFAYQKTEKYGPREWATAARESAKKLKETINKAIGG